MLRNPGNMYLAIVIVNLVLTVVGAILWRSGDPSGAGLTRTNALASGAFAGLWLLNVGFFWAGCSLCAVAVCGWIVELKDIDRAVWRRMRGVTALGAGTLATLVAVEVASWMGASRQVVLALLGLLGVLGAAFVVWGTGSTSVALFKAYRAGRSAPPLQPGPPQL